MRLLRLDYGDLLRPEFCTLPSRGWGQCSNWTADSLVVFGPKSIEDRSVFDNSPYILPPGRTTPDGWDCDGFFLPVDRSVRLWGKRFTGALALKFWDFRRFTVWTGEHESYRCSWPNGVFEPSQINWAIPNFSYRDILKRTDR